MQKYLTTTALAGFVAFALTHPVTVLADDASNKEKTSAVKVTKKKNHVKKHHAKKQISQKNEDSKKIDTLKLPGEHDVFEGVEAPGRAAEAGEPDRDPRRILSNDANKLALSVSGEIAVEATATNNKKRGAYSVTQLPNSNVGLGELVLGAPNFVNNNGNFFTRSDNGFNLNKGHYFGVADANITFTVSTEVNGIRVGGNIELIGQANTIQNAKRAYLSVESKKIGDFYFGDVKGVTAVARRNGVTMQAGNISSDGNYKNTIFLSDGAMLSNKMVGDTASATKFSAYSPFLGGLRVGFSYTPNTDHRGDAAMNSRSDLQPRLEAVRDGQAYSPLAYFNTGIVEGAIQFVKEINGLKIDASLMGIAGKTKDRYLGGNEVDLALVGSNPVGLATLKNPLPTGFRNVKAWEAGFNVEHSGIVFGAGYRNNGKSNTAPLAKPSAFKRFVNAGSAWNLGLGYRFGKNYVSAEYAQSQRKYMASSTAPIQNVKTHFYGVNGEHKVAPGMLAYAQAGTFRFKSNNPAPSGTNQNNKGSTFTLGTRLLF